MDILLKAIPIAIPVILVILIFLMGYVRLQHFLHQSHIFALLSLPVK